MSTALTRTAALEDAIQRHRDTLTTLLPERAQQERFVTALITYVAPNTNLHSEKLQDSLMLAACQLAKLGLDPGVDAHLIPRGGVVRCEIGYKGAVKIMLRATVATHVDTYLIYDREHFIVEKGRVIEHRAVLDPGKRGAFLAAVAQLHMPDGTVIERIVDREEMAIAHAAGGPAWKTSPGEMRRKTAVLRLAKMVTVDSMTMATLNEIEKAAAIEAEVIERPRSTRRILSPSPAPMQLANESAPETTDPATVDVDADTTEHGDL